MEKGVLYIISGPIGNLSDTTFRAIEMLKQVNLILSEDTRETDKLLRHYNITNRQISYRDQNHDRVLAQICQELDAGSNLALVSDCGTPLISDPGYKLVEHLVNNDYPVVSIPGPSSVISALTVSGLPTDKFSFLGFLPRTQGKIDKLLKDYGSLDSTLVIFESPFRVYKLLQNINSVLGNRKIAVVKDLTKVFESVFRGTTEELLEQLKDVNLKGEYIIIVAKEGF